MFSFCLISLYATVKWLASSPDLLNCHYFLRGYLKPDIYKYHPTKIKLKTAICQVVAEALPEISTVPHVWRSPLRRYYF